MSMTGPDSAIVSRLTQGDALYITTLSHKGVIARVLAALAGQRHISTTQRYIDLNDNVLHAAVEMS